MAIRNKGRLKIFQTALSFQAIYWHEQYSKMGEERQNNN